MAKERLGSVYSKNSNFKAEFHKLINYSITVPEFEAAWQELMEKYDLKEHHFLTPIYESRHPDLTISLQGGVMLKTGWPIEKHAASIYTSKMLEMFSEHIFDSAAYNLIEIVLNLKYQTVHSDASRREKWSKVQYEVMLRLGVDKVPDAHILKRWTKNASDVLPQYFAHLQKDRGSLRSESYRHASLHVAALELVNIGDKNIDCYHEVLKYLKDGKEKFGQLYQHTDGRSLQEILASTVVRADEEAAGNIIVPGQLHSAVIAPVRNRPEGRPTNTRDKPSYELKRKRTKFCTDGV
ncbi:uncharacterized protein LOC100836713 [Brachypodium distachyon]|uniref:uncharacterized protein LOC100836713 n=1 Tax=Brachypodium distachyon TaxID=15368 RepID=UPI00052FECE9|nr:uncharacterized protein LOC100836713 [Brachypodium distachyon]|eukprot:XP_010229715.1 uncharacterized protein LOC100836713 [Brachypodium distachyon]